MTIGNKENSNEVAGKRYFFVAYSFEGGTGSCTITSEGMLNHKKFRVDIKEIHPHLQNPHITHFTEMTKEDYECFIK